MVSDFKVSIDRNRTKKKKQMQRLNLIKERYEKLILKPKKEIEFEIERD
ncbi:MAG: hypothetical protein MRK01_01455 [Candidatus Scalindua sp.]|nr:hypothetical protein [Candidatus Scalindua sp.]